MPLIDVTYFIGELNVPNTDKPSVQENLDFFINKYEKKFIKMFLGDVLYADYVANNTDQKWVEFKAKLFDADSKESPIANYTYFYYVRDANTYNSGIGIVKAVSENASDTDGKIKTTRAWNEMVCMAYDLYKYMNDNVSIYGPLPYHATFRFNPYLDWSGWYYSYGYRVFRYIPEIYTPINSLNL